MADEAAIINNPDSTPGAVSTGYQLQNTNMVAGRVGMDATVVTGGTGQCVLEISGPVDVNGVLYSIGSAVTFTLTVAGTYYIHLAGSGNNLTPTIGTGANTFDPDKNARYTDTGSYRVLNWVVFYDGTTSYPHRLVNPQNATNDFLDAEAPEETWLTTTGTTWTAKRTKYYTMYVTGCGGNGGSGGTKANRGTSGGCAGSTGIKRILVNAGTTWTMTLTTGSGNSTTFTDGTTTITAGNQGGAVVGADTTLTGGGTGYGGSGWDSDTSGINAAGNPGAPGGASFWGAGGSGGQAGYRGNGGAGGAGVAYGSGGGNGGGGDAYGGGTGTGGTGGAGKAGCVRIVG